MKVCGPNFWTPAVRWLSGTEFQRFNKILRDNLADFIYLQQYPGTPSEKLPARINWNGFRSGSYDSAWNAAKQKNQCPFSRNSREARNFTFPCVNTLAEW